MKSPMILISSGRTMGTLSMQRQQSTLYAACLYAGRTARVCCSAAETPRSAPRGATACCSRAAAICTPRAMGRPCKANTFRSILCGTRKSKCCSARFMTAASRFSAFAAGCRQSMSFWAARCASTSPDTKTAATGCGARPRYTRSRVLHRWSTATTIRQWTRSRPRCTPPPGRRTARSKRCGTKAHRCLACSGTPSVWCRPCATMRRAKTIWRCSAGCASGADSTKPGRKSCPVFSLSCFTG